MPATYSLIASNTLSSSATSVTFSAIPATYTDLVLRVSARSSAGNQPTHFWVYPNNTQNLVASTTWIRGDGSAASSSRYSNQAEMYVAIIASSLMTANSFGSAEIYFPNYGSSANKVTSGFGVEEANQSTSVYMQANASLWRDTTAISSLVIDSPGTFDSGSSFFLYGIKSS